MDRKVKLVLDSLAQGRSLDEVAEDLGYASSQSVGQYMRRRGYRWDRDAGTYLPADDPGVHNPGDGGRCGHYDHTLPGPNGDLTPEAQELLSRAQEVLRLLDGGTGAMADSLSSPLLRGHLLIKSLRLPHPLVEAIESYAQDRRLTQKAVFEAALVDFLVRRGGIPHEAS